MQESAARRQDGAVNFYYCSVFESILIPSWRKGSCCMGFVREAPDCPEVTRPSTLYKLLGEAQTLPITEPLPLFFSGGPVPGGCSVSSQSDTPEE